MINSHVSHKHSLLALSITLTLLAGSNIAFADNPAYGIANTTAGTTVTVSSDTNQTVTAVSGDAATSAMAYGILASGSGAVVQIQGNTTMLASATNTAGGKFHAYAVSSQAGGEVDVNTTDGSTGLGKTIQLTGDVNNDSMVKLVLDTSDSYLQGNFSQTSANLNFTLANGATWRPVFDNRYGTFADYSNDPNYVYTAGGYSGGYLNGPAVVSNGGVIDMTWDNRTRTSYRELALQSYSGDGTVIIATNVNTSGFDTGDYVQIDEGKGGTLTVKVSYDPIFDSGASVQGTSSVVTVVSGNLNVVGGTMAYNAKNYTPHLINNAGMWAIDSFAVSSSLGNNANTNVKTVADGHYALHSLWLGETNSLDKRLGELRNLPASAQDGIWARYDYNKLEAGSGDRAKVKANLFQLGYDKKQTVTSGNIYRGLAVSYAKGTSDLKSGNGDVKETTLSLYQSYVAQDGRYYDIVLKGGKFMNDYRITDSSAAASDSDYSTWAYSLSGEIGKRKTWTNGFYLEPQVELILGHMNSADYTTSTGMKSTAKASNLALTRLGCAVGKQFGQNNIYAKASYFHDFGSGINIEADGVAYNRDAAKNWGEFALGGSVRAGKACTIYGELSKYVGQLKSPIMVNVGARWSF